MTRDADDRYVIRCPRRAPGDPDGLVSARSLRHRQAVEQFAHYFRREFRYDFLHYEAGEGAGWDRASQPAEDEAAAYPFASGCSYDGRYVGAACFRWRLYRDIPPRWALAWVWLHPYERRRGLLTLAWPVWVARHAPFAIELPLSDAMETFVRRQGRCLACWDRPLAAGQTMLCAECVKALSTGDTDKRLGDPA